MSKHHPKTPAPAPETKKQELVAPPETVATATKTAESVVDDVFDTVTAWAAQGLTLAKQGLEVTARWLDGRAKVVGELASKLESTSRSHAGADAPQSPAQSA